MAVLVEGISVIIKGQAIEDSYDGGWEALKSRVPNATLCADGEIVRVGFMVPQDAQAYVQQLEQRGLVFLKDGKAIEIAEADQLRGLTTVCDWLDFGSISIDQAGHRVAACRLKGSTIQRVLCPEGWRFEESLSSRHTFVPTSEVDERLPFAGRHAGIDEYMDRQRGEKLFSGRTTTSAEDKKRLLNLLFRENRIDIRRAGFLDSSPSPLPPDLEFDKVEGMMLGLAIGDALGITTEGTLPRRRRERYGEIRDYIPNRYVSVPVGFPSDDSQLSFWTLEQIIADGCFDPESVARRFCRGDRIFGIGATVSEFIHNFRDEKLPWYACGPKSAGNGALMRIAPVVIPHLKAGTSDLWVDTVLSAMMTHNDSSSIAACVSFVNMLWQLLGMKSPPRAEWWLDTYIAVARELERDETYEPRGGSFSGFRGTLWEFVNRYLREAYAKYLSVVEACDAWYSGAYLLETVPSVLYILMKHGHDPEEAIVRAVNDTKDNDTIAAIVGAAVGALHGKKAIPERWISHLSGRTTDRDDGRMFELLAKARRLWWGKD